MMRVLKSLLMVGAAVGLAAALALFAPAAGPGRDEPPPGPRTLDEVTQVADRLGLHYQSDRADGRTDGRLVLSDRPLTWERAGYLRWEDPGHRCWAGTVAVDARAHNLDCPAGEHAAQWGDVVLFGDPALIGRLLAASGPGAE
jgi:hypothetical protein